MKPEQYVIRVRRDVLSWRAKLLCLAAALVIVFGSISLSDQDGKRPACNCNCKYEEPK